MFYQKIIPYFYVFCNCNFLHEFVKKTASRATSWQAFVHRLAHVAKSNGKNLR